MHRTHHCGELTKEHIGQNIKLAGWVNSRRDHGGLIFIDLRDRWGLTQCVFDPKSSKIAWKTADSVRNEYIIEIQGLVRKRPKDMINPDLSTGEIEIDAKSIKILNKSKTPPFEIEWRSDDSDLKKTSKVSENIRLKYRYLDLRSKRMQKNLKIRHYLIKYIRQYLNKQNFLEIETPLLGKSTPEGARDFIVPSRLHVGKFYALPQSPQQYKQLLMIAGIDRYYQIARCLRDEDQRGDRQPEFTQLDLEMAFVERNDVINLTENLFKQVFKQLKKIKLLNKKIILDKPWPKIKYKEALLKYGTDRPDLRFELEIQDISKLLEKTKFQVFASALNKKGGTIRAIVAKGANKTFSRGDIDKLTAFIKNLGAKGLAYIKIENKSAKTKEQEKEIDIKNKKLILTSPIIKFFTDKELKAILEETKANEGDIIFFGAGQKSQVSLTLGELRIKLAKKLKLIDKSVHAPCWIIDFPLFEEEKEDGHFAPKHHMFTSPDPKDIALLDKNPKKAKSWQYDLVINGFEVGGGSIRIYDPKIQNKIFDLIGFDEKKKQEFNHMLKAFTYGAPPHGGIAPGIDRIAMILANEPNIREVIAFPKSQKAEDLMMNAPAEITPEQLKEVHIKPIA